MGVVPDAQHLLMTVTGPMPPADLGVTDAHDHLFLRTPETPGQELEDPDAAIAEVREAVGAGLGAIVEMTPIGLGRRPDLLRAVSEATGVPIIGATGFHRDTHYPPDHWVHDTPVEVLAERVVTDLERGMHPSDWDDPDAPLDPARAGAIKAGASYHHISASEGRRLEAVAIASRRTGAAILVHAEIGTAGHEIVDRLEAYGVTTDRIALAHMDRNPDPELHAEIAARGVTLEYDTAGRTKYHPDTRRHRPRGRHARSGPRRSTHARRGPRPPRLLPIPRRRAGDGVPVRHLRAAPPRRIGDAATDAILVTNPARFYAMPVPE